MKKLPISVLIHTRLKLDEVISKLDPYLKRLPPDVEQTLNPTGEVSLDFCKKAHELAADHYDLLPVFLKEPGSGEEFLIIQELDNLEKRIELLLKSVKYIKLAMGSNAMEYALIFFDTVKNAARRDIPGIRVIYDELKTQIPSKKSRRKKAS